MSSSSATHVEATLGIDTSDVSQVLGLITRVHSAQTENSTDYAKITPSLADVDAAGGKLKSSRDASDLPAKGTGIVQTREVERRNAVAQLKGQCGWLNIQTLTMSHAAALAYVTKSGYVVAGTRTHVLKALVVSQAHPGAPVELVASRSVLLDGVETSQALIYHWRYTLPNAAPVELKSTPTGKQVVLGLPALVQGQFQVSIDYGEIKGPWCAPVPYLVQ
jgi:hypothetical protein